MRKALFGDKYEIILPNFTTMIESIYKNEVLKSKREYSSQEKINVVNYTKEEASQLTVHQWGRNDKFFNNKKYLKANEFESKKQCSNPDPVALFNVDKLNSPLVQAL